MFSLFPTDPKKALLQTTGLAILAGADPGQALSALPSQIAQLQNQADEMALRQEQLGISKSQLAIQQAANDREQALQDQKAKLGAAMQSYNLSPSAFGGFAPGTLPEYQGTKAPGVAPTDWSANDMVAREFKGDNAMPIGQEGNPIAKKIMALPLSVRQGMAEAPLAAAEVMNNGLQQGLTDAFTDPASTPGKAANFVNLRGPNGDILSFDIGDPTQRAAAQEKVAQGYVEENPQTPKEDKPQVLSLTDGKEVRTMDISSQAGKAQFDELTAKGWNTAPTQTLNKDAKDPLDTIDSYYEPQVKEIIDQRAALDKQVDDMTVMGSLILRPDIYSGAGGTAVNALGKTLQDTMGLFPDVDFSRPVNAEAMRKALALGLKNTLLKDPQMAQSDRQYLNSMVMGMGDGPKAIARGIAMKTLEARYAAEREAFIMSAKEQGMKNFQAIRAWNEKKSAVIRNIFNEENINALTTHFADGANDQSLLDYAGQRLPAAEAQVEKQLGIEPSDSPPIDLNKVAKPTTKEEYDKLQPGTPYLHPDGQIKVK